MNITTDPDQEIWHNMSTPGAYEWWYFDAEDRDSGVSVVVIWFSGFPFSPSYTEHYEKWKKGITPHPPSPSDYSAFSFQLYENGREIVNFIRDGKKELFDASRSDIGVRFEKNRFIYNPLRDEYTLDIDFTFPVRHKEIKATLLFKSVRRISYKQIERIKGPLHQWLLSVPKASVIGTIEVIENPGNTRRIISFGGNGYHDHNLGTVPMQESIARWHWGRAFSEQLHIVYYVVFFKNREYKPLVLLVRHDAGSEKVTVHDSMCVSESNFRRGFFSPLHCRKLEFHDNTCCLKINHNSVLDSGPFYLRFSSAMSVQIDGEYLENISGISEFLNPSRLQSKFMRFFIRSRIWRDGEQSTMYNSYNRFKRSLDWNNH